MTTVSSVRAREVLDSRGNPTVEVELANEKFSARALVPSGASTGSQEALELRDGGKRFFGRGVKKAVFNVNDIISKKISGSDFPSQKDLDSFLIELDGTPNKSKLGANAILGVSLAFCRLQSLEKNLPLYAHLAAISKRAALLPVPQMNILNGGKHAGFENDIQEHMIVPRAKTFSESLWIGAEVYQQLGRELKKRFGPSVAHVADEGGFAPKELRETPERLELLMKIIEDLGYQKNISFALDAAATEFFKNGFYFLGSKKFTSAELIDYYKNLVSTFPLVSIEDGLAETDWGGWVSLTAELGKKIQIVGDDILVTNPLLIKKAVSLQACNALLLKVNQIGTVTEALNAEKMSFENKWKVIVSHRSGETEDVFIADLVVGIGAGQCKFGAPARGERTAKYNQLLRIEGDLGAHEFKGGK